jgi:hypothetical protein
MSDLRVTYFYACLVDWAVSKGAENVDKLPGLWRGETEEWIVQINGRPHEIAFRRVATC